MVSLQLFTIPKHGAISGDPDLPIQPGMPTCHIRYVWDMYGISIGKDRDYLQKKDIMPMLPSNQQLSLSHGYLP